MIVKGERLTALENSALYPEQIFYSYNMSKLN